MKLSLLAVNYTGAHFRGLESKFDGRLHRIEIQGKEEDVVDFILGNYSYGSGELDEWEDDYDEYSRVPGEHTVEALVDRLGNDDITLFDGCGGFYWIKDEAGKMLWEYEDWKESMEAMGEKEEDALNLGLVDTEYVGAGDEVVNRMVKDLVNNLEN